MHQLSFTMRPGVILQHVTPRHVTQQECRQCCFWKPFPPHQMWWWATFSKNPSLFHAACWTELPTLWAAFATVWDETTNLLLITDWHASKEHLYPHYRFIICDMCFVLVWDFTNCERKIQQVGKRDIKASFLALLLKSVTKIMKNFVKVNCFLSGCLGLLILSSTAFVELHFTIKQVTSKTTGVHARTLLYVSFSALKLVWQVLKGDYMSWQIESIHLRS